MTESTSSSTASTFGSIELIGIPQTRYGRQNSNKIDAAVEDAQKALVDLVERRDTNADLMHHARLAVTALTQVITLAADNPIEAHRCAN